MEFNQDLSLNQVTSISTRICNAKEFLHENPTEKTTTAARVYNLPPSTLQSSIDRTHKPRTGHGGHNKILLDHEKKAIHQFIQSLLASGIQSTSQLIFRSICNLKRAQNPNFKIPSRVWFSTWWKENGLHKIKSKPLAVVRMTAQQEQEIIQWFREYRITVGKYGIKRRNIMNFDEAGFQVGCPKGQYLLVPLDIQEVSVLFIKL